uniref:Immunoglobulin domain-containing protein n=1 Tax=Sinocyclocheilus grahami TaxID=75366 RepID=A0A672LE81_SINGR
FFFFSGPACILVSYFACDIVDGAPETVTGHRGERVDIRCSYKAGYESNSKYFCKGECIFGFRNIMVKSGSPAEDERFSLTDNTTARVFTVSITDLRTEDTGLYWCATTNYGYINFVGVKLTPHWFPCNSTKIHQSQNRSNLKGSYDAISSFPFSLECYKLFVNR